jgi:hypothetical protein
MPKPLFDVFFRGSLLAGADPGEVRDRLAAQFGLAPAEVQRLFGGGSVCVKRAVDVDTASQLRGRFRDAGALVDIRPVEAAPRPVPPSVPATDATLPAAAAADDLAGWTLAAPRTGSLADCARPVAAAALPDVSGLDLAPAGTPVAGDDAPPPAIDISHLSVAPPGTGTLEDCRKEAPARPIGDISHLQLADD